MMKKSKIALELACSLIALTVNPDSSIIDITDDIACKCSIIGHIIFDSIANYKAGNKDGVRYEF